MNKEKKLMELLGDMINLLSDICGQSGIYSEFRAKYLEKIADKYMELIKQG